ncbi:TPA: 6-hydroxymethylpterin diphosphokinase MptE-like protein [Enterococcus faecium]
MILSAKTRKIILSLPFAREVSNIIINITNENFYRKINKKKHFDDKIREVRNSQKGKRCFIVGSGPSLTIEQLNAIKDEDSFGANRIYKMFEKTEWRPKYYVIQDKYDSTRGVYEKLEVENLFISDFYWKEHGMSNPNAICYHIKRTLKQTKNLPFSEDCASFIQAAATVTFTMIQLACYMGYSEIYLIGMDHIYANVTNDKGIIIQKNKVKSHVFEEENPTEVVANIAYMEDAYRTARQYCETHNIKIYNATLGGALDVFERVNFWKVV